MRTNRRRMMCPVVDMNVEYIMTNGHQFILTDWIPLTDTKIRMHFQIKDWIYKSGMNNTIFHSIGENNSIFQINSGDLDYEHNILYIWNNIGYAAGGKIININISNYEDTQYPLSLYISKDSVRFFKDWVFIKEPLSLRTQPCTTPLKLFANSNKIAYNRAKLLIYGIQCWNNGILERDFVPAKKKGIYGLYDKVNKKFWRSNSGVDFLGKDK